MAPRKLYFEAIKVGDELPPLAKAPIDRVQLARYAGATQDFAPVFVDELAAKAQGLPSVMVPNHLIAGFLGQLLGEWVRGAFVRRLQVRFSRMLWPGDALVCKARVTDRWGQDGKYFVELELWAENQDGQLAVRGGAVVKIFYSLEDENRFRLGQPPVVVNVPRQNLQTVAAASATQPVDKPKPEAKPKAAAKPVTDDKAKKPAKPKKAR